MTPHPCLRRATTSVLVAVALISGAILLVGDQFGSALNSAGNSVLTQPARASGEIAACVAEESMRLITVGRERCRPDELELASGPTPATEPSLQGVRTIPASVDGAGRGPDDGVSGFEIVTAKAPVAVNRAATGEARCPASKVAVGGGVRRDIDSAGRAGSEDQMEVTVSGPLLPGGGNDGHGWTATVRNTGPSPISIVVAAICVFSR